MSMRTLRPSSNAFDLLQAEGVLLRAFDDRSCVRSPAVRGVPKGDLCTHSA